MIAGPGTTEVALLALAVLADCAIGLGLVIPAELALLLLGNATSDDVAHPHSLLAVAAVAGFFALLGSHFGLLLGRRWRPPQRGLAIVHRLGPERSAAVSRMLPYARPLTGALVGAQGMSIATFARWTTVTTLMWVGTLLLIGRRLGDVIALDPTVDHVIRLCLWLPLVLGLLAPELERFLRRFG